jgi:hypothetical protein
MNARIKRKRNLLFSGNEEQNISVKKALKFVAK